MSAGTRALALEVESLAVMPAAGDPEWAHWLAPAELAHGRGFARAEEHFGARVAAKRAVARVLDWPAGTPWDDVQIVREASAPPRVLLAGALEARRRELGLPVPGVSLSHAAGHVAALAWLPDGV